MKRLEELEYILMHRTQGPLVTYELRYAGEGAGGRRFVIGLDHGGAGLDHSGEGLDYDEDWSGQKGDWSGTGRVPAGQWSGAGRGHGASDLIDKKAANGTSRLDGLKIASRVRK